MVFRSVDRHSRCCTSMSSVHWRGQRSRWLSYQLQVHITTWWSAESRRDNHSNKARPKVNDATPKEGLLLHFLPVPHSPPPPRPGVHSCRNVLWRTSSATLFSASPAVEARVLLRGRILRAWARAPAPAPRIASAGRHIVRCRRGYRHVTEHTLPVDRAMAYQPIGGRRRRRLVQTTHIDNGFLHADSVRR